MLEQFYEVGQNCINLVPIFVGFVRPDQTVALSEEHSEYKWIPLEEAARYLIFQHQRDMLAFIERHFVRETPHDFLRIEVPGSI